MAIPHMLVVGGSGMLAGLCLRLAGEGCKVSIIARDRNRLQSLTEKAPPGGILPVAVDYCDAQAFERALDRLAGDCDGPPTQAVGWIHDEVAPDASLQIADHVGIFWHVLGSAAADPSAPRLLADWRDRISRYRPAHDYRQIVLGFVIEAQRSRWLTDAEICNGVYDAIRNAQSTSIVGTIAPWSRRPR
jgi:hypothetical protein